MPLTFPPAPTLGQIEPYNGKNWRWMDGYWSAVSQFAPVSQTPNTFQAATMLDDYRETLVMTSRTQPLNVRATLLQYI